MFGLTLLWPNSKKKDLQQYELERNIYIFINLYVGMPRHSRSDNLPLSGNDSK